MIDAQKASVPPGSHGSRPPGLATTAPSTYALLRDAADWNPDGTALTFFSDPAAPPSRLTHRQFFGRLTQAANLFHRLGVSPGDTISLLLPSMPDTMIALWAAEAAGIANPINFLLQANAIAAMLRATQTRVLVALGPHPVLDIWRKVEAIRDQVPSLKAVLTIGPPADAPGVLSFERELTAEPQDRLVSGRVITRDEIAACFHTGGSTGAPKLALHTHGNQVFSAVTLAEAWKFDSRSRVMNGLPVFHVAGSILLNLAPLAAGSEMILPTAAGMRNPQVVANHWKLVERYRPTVVGGIPTLLVGLLDVPLSGEDIRSVEFCASGGAPLPTVVAHEFERRIGLPVHEIYGMTECAGLISVAPRHLPPRYGAAGYRIPGVEVEARRLRADGTPGERLPDGEVGVLVVRGPNVFPGYLNPKQNEAAFTADGWLNTGDLGSVDAEGLVRITGRAKDVIIRGGHNIDPAGIEEAANSHPAVAVSAAVGMPDAYAGEVPLLFVTLKQGSQVSIEELMVHMRANVPEGPARPREVVILPEMPMTTVGKISKPVLRRDATRRAAAAAAAAVLEGTQVESSIEVEERDDGRALVRVRILSCPEELRPVLAAKLSDALSRFTFAHELGFA